MKILIDPQIFWHQRFGGISRYFTELIYAFEQTGEVIVQCPLLINDNEHLTEKGLINTRFRKILKELSPRIFNILYGSERDYALKLIRKAEYDVFLPSYYDTYFLKDVDCKKIVLTVYDMIYERYVSLSNTDPQIIKNKSLLVEKSPRLIAISKSTKNDILEFNPQKNPSLIDVIYLSHSVGKNFGNTFPHKDYILFVGNRSYYKNFQFLIESIAGILIDRDLKLLCAGSNEFTEEELLLLRDLGIDKNVIKLNFEEQDLYNIYRNALYFVFPSEYEGFGIPILEAMYSECPVLIPKHSSFPEVAGDAALYYENYNSKDLLEKATELLDNPELRDELIHKGKDRATNYSWEKTASEVLISCQKIIG